MLYRSRMDFRSLFYRGGVRCTTLLVGIVPFLAEHGAAQTMCEDPDVTVMATAPSLDGYEILFRQNSVSFYSRLPPRDSAGPAVVLIRNGNPHPVEVSYGIELQLQSDAGARTISLGRHCAQIGPQGYASSTEDAPARTVAVRVRNLTISNLSNAPTQSRATEAGSAATDPPPPNRGDQQPVSGSTSADSPGSAAGVRNPSEVLPGAHPDPAPAPEAETSVERIPAGAGGSRPALGTVAVDAMIRAFYLVAILVLTLAGLALVLPVLGTLYLFALSLVVLAARLLGGRSR